MACLGSAFRWEGLEADLVEWPDELLEEPPLFTALDFECLSLERYDGAASRGDADLTFDELELIEGLLAFLFSRLDVNRKPFLYGKKLQLKRIPFSTHYLQSTSGKEMQFLKTMFLPIVQVSGYTTVLVHKKHRQGEDETDIDKPNSKQTGFGVQAWQPGNVNDAQTRS